MKSLIFSMLTGLLATLATASQTVPPAKEPFTPFFHLQVAEARGNKSIEGMYFHVGDGFDSEVRLRPDRSDAAVFYTAIYKDQKPRPGPVLVNNASNFQDRGSKWIAGTSTCDTCGLPFSASAFFRSIDGWKEDGGFLYEFRLDRFSHDVRFNLTDEGSRSQTLTQFCYADFASTWRFVVLSTYLKECVPVRLRWVFADL